MVDLSLLHRLPGDPTAGAPELRRTFPTKEAVNGQYDVLDHSELARNRSTLVGVTKHFPSTRPSACAVTGYLSSIGVTRIDKTKAGPVDFIQTQSPQPTTHRYLRPGLIQSLPFTGAWIKQLSLILLLKARKLFVSPTQTCETIYLLHAYVKVEARFLNQEV